MNYQIQIENLGAIEKAEFTVTPMTILAGKNGTGKSFVTKFLYSVFNSINENILKNSLDKISYQNYRLLSILSENNQTEVKDFLFELSLFFLGIIHCPITTDLVNEIEHKFKKLLEIENKINYKIPLEVKRKVFMNDRDVKTILEDEDFVRIVKANTQQLILACKDMNEYYVSKLQETLKNQIKENFQITELVYLIRFNHKKAIFKIKNYLSVSIINDTLDIEIQKQPNISNNLTFFESPVYWKISPFVYKYLQDDFLSGVPKYFLDLRKLLFTDFKYGERPKFIIDCANNLEQSLQGKFRTTMGDDLVFENQQGQAIDKSLVSFGMTNLGILQAILNKNIINQGSFIFIDEPESNLHPEWQTILAETLVTLAKNGVYVVITSHSTDMLRAFDIASKEQEINDELSVQYFQQDGRLLALDNPNLSAIAQAEQQLLESYDNLNIREYLL